MELVIGNKYKFKHDDKTLVFIGTFRGWHQFTLENGVGIWAEVAPSDLHLMEPLGL